MSESKPLYSVHPSVLITRTWMTALQESTGRSLDEWLQLVNQSGPPAEHERREWLKQHQGLGANQAAWIAARAARTDTGSDDPEAYLLAALGYVERMFRGPRSALRPIYDELLRLALSLGEDVKACPCQGIVPLYRNHLFAHIKPASRTHLHLGLALGLRRAQGRLRDSGGFAKKDRITHRIAISSIADIDAGVARWLRIAYDENADCMNQALEDAG